MILGAPRKVSLMRMAIVHPWYLAIGGAEQTVNELTRAFPNADHFCLLFDRKHLPPELQNKNLNSSLFNHLPLKYNLYRYMLPIWPMAIESIDLRGYDVVISSDSSITKGVLLASECSTYLLLLFSDEAPLGPEGRVLSANAGIYSSLFYCGNPLHSNVGFSSRAKGKIILSRFLSALLSASRSITAVIRLSFILL